MRATSWRMAEMYESIKIIRQCAENMPDGLFRVNDYKISPPPRDEMKTSMEAMIHHFKLFSEGYHVPEGETYTCVLKRPRVSSGCIWLLMARTGRIAVTYGRRALRICRRWIL